jgi:hypothetical protein
MHISIFPDALFLLRYPAFLDHPIAIHFRQHDMTNEDIRRDSSMIGSAS